MKTIKKTITLVLFLLIAIVIGRSVVKGLETQLAEFETRTTEYDLNDWLNDKDNTKVGTFVARINSDKKYEVVITIKDTEYKLISEKPILPYSFKPYKLYEKDYEKDPDFKGIYYNKDYNPKLFYTDVDKLDDVKTLDDINYTIYELLTKTAITVIKDNTELFGYIEEHDIDLSGIPTKYFTLNLATPYLLGLDNAEITFDVRKKIYGTRFEEKPLGYHFFTDDLLFKKQMRISEDTITITANLGKEHKINATRYDNSLEDYVVKRFDDKNKEYESKDEKTKPGKYILTTWDEFISNTKLELLAYLRELSNTFSSESKTITTCSFKSCPTLLDQKRFIGRYNNAVDNYNATRDSHTEYHPRYEESYEGAESMFGHNEHYLEVYLGQIETFKENYFKFIDFSNFTFKNNITRKGNDLSFTENITTDFNIKTTQNFGSIADPLDAPEEIKKLAEEYENKIEKEYSRRNSLHEQEQEETQAKNKKIKITLGVSIPLIIILIIGITVPITLKKKKQNNN